jgi:hypothetical protein
MRSTVAITLVLLALAFATQAQTPEPPTYDELFEKMKPLTRQQLINCLKVKPTGCPLEDRYRDPIWIAAELGRRKHPELLIAAYGKADKVQRQYLAEALWHIHDPRVVDFMRTIAFDNLPEGQDTEEVFFPLDYLAQRCDQRALARLNRRVNFDESFPVGCMLWAPTLEAFGRCNYRAAAPNLVLALNAACVNIIDASEKDLQKFFPGSCQQTKSFEEEQRCYKKLLKDYPTPK